MQQVEGVLAGTPVHLSVAALALAAHHVKVGVMLAHKVEVLAALPLKSYTLNNQSILCRINIHSPLFGRGGGGEATDYLFHVVLSVGVERAHIELHLGVLLAQRGRQIFLIKTYRSLCRPRAARIGRIAVGLVLVHHHVDRYILFCIEVDELAEHVRVGLQVARVLDEIVLRGQLLGEEPSALTIHKLHLIRINGPAPRSPRGGESRVTHGNSPPHGGS